MEITTSLKKRFCKDYAIPIKVYKEPYWSSRLELFDYKFNTLEKWGTFCKEIEQFDTQEEYFASYNKFKDEVITHIKNNPLYKDLNSFNMNMFNIPNYNIGRKTVFKESNVGKTLVSVDLTSGNFSAMKYFSKKLVDGKDTYYDFISQFTEKEIFRTSKYIRQVIFGNCNPKRQTKIEHYMMNIILVELISHLNRKGLKVEDVVQSFTTDEIVFEYFDGAEAILVDLHELAVANGFSIHFDIYELDKIHGADAYVLYSDLKDTSFKCVNPLYYPIILRLEQGLDIREEDLVFYHEHQLCRFLEVPDIRIGEWVNNEKQI